MNAEPGKEMSMRMWKRYQVQWTFVTPLCAQVPGQSSLIEPWLNARKARRVVPPDSRSLHEIAEEVFTTLPEEMSEEEDITLIFQRHAKTKALCMRGATIQAHLKDCAYQITTYHTGRVKGEKSFDTRWKNCIYQAPAEYWVPILQDGRAIYEPTGVREKPIHIKGPKGPRNALKAFEYVEDVSGDAPVTMAFQLWVLETHAGHDTVSRADIETVMRYGGVHGYAGERSEDGGRYLFSLTELTEEG